MLASNTYIYILFTSFLFSIVITPLLIVILKKNNAKQIVREEGPKNHKSKSGTPTLGGISFLLVYTIIFLITAYTQKDSINIIELLFLILMPVSFGLIGFIDDILIIKFKKNDGLSPKIKFNLQVLLTIVFYYLYFTNINDTNIYIKEYVFDLRMFYGLLVIFLILGTTNAVNLTDGLDGLATGIVIIILSFTSYILFINNQNTLFISSIIFIGALLGFLLFNKNKAHIFMGDTGSLALGAYIATLFILSKLEIFLLIFGLIFIIETLSVILQVFYFKKTKGKRLFRMTPIHHHYELKYGETKVVTLFYLFTILTSVIGIYIYLM